MPAMTLASVDLPPPLGPVMATKRSCTVRLTSCRISLLSSVSYPTLRSSSMVKKLLCWGLALWQVLPYRTEIILYHEPAQSTSGISREMVDFSKKIRADAKKILTERGQRCYALAVKSVDREKYRPTSAQRARHLLRAGTGTGRE